MGKHDHAAFAEWERPSSSAADDCAGGKHRPAVWLCGRSALQVQTYPLKRLQTAFTTNVHIIKLYVYAFIVLSSYDSSLQRVLQNSTISDAQPTLLHGVLLMLLGFPLAFKSVKLPGLKVFGLCSAVCVWPCLHTRLTVGCSCRFGFLREWRKRRSGQSSQPSL